ncbi:MAG: hypothetical protein OEW00_11170 [candidate division Zixibacteria bacterium]|nr:hypothetical protein [candidate division Zixibacteria bacterium]
MRTSSTENISNTPDAYMKRFLWASIVYLILAAVCGILSVTAGLGEFGIFALFHFNVLGFVSMLVFGLGYSWLPRLNCCRLRYAHWVAVHFWLGNAGLIGLVVFRGLFILTAKTPYLLLSAGSAIALAATIVMFVINLWMTLTPPDAGRT